MVCFLGRNPQRYEIFLDISKKKGIYPLDVRFDIVCVSIPFPSKSLRICNGYIYIPNQGTKLLNVYYTYITENIY